MRVRSRGIARLFLRGIRHLSLVAGAIGIWTAQTPAQGQSRPVSTDRVVLESRVTAVRQAMLGAADASGQVQPVKAQWGNWNNWKNSWNNWPNWLNR
jgi:hypothetical protein